MVQPRAGVQQQPALALHTASCHSPLRDKPGLSGVSTTSTTPDVVSRGYAVEAARPGGSDGDASADMWCLDSRMLDRGMPWVRRDGQMGCLRRATLTCCERRALHASNAATQSETIGRAERMPFVELELR
jgi:hypothetical protein